MQSNYLNPVFLRWLGFGKSQSIARYISIDKKVFSFWITFESCNPLYVFVLEPNNVITSFNYNRYYINSTKVLIEY